MISHLLRWFSRPVSGSRRGSAAKRSTLRLEILEDRSLPATGITGGGLPFDNTQPSLPLHYMIATAGILPTPNTGAGAGEDTMLGEVRLFAGNFAPAGWMFADGQLLSKSANPDLFGLLGTTYGGDGLTNFALPDLRGRTVVGAGQGPGLTNRSLGAKFGAESVTLTTAQLPAHNHTLPAGSTTGSTGGNQPFEDTQPSLALNYIVPLQGIFNFLPEIHVFAGNFAPGSWDFADGRLLSKAQNNAMSALYGTTYGGDGVTNFALPDLRGRVAAEAGQGTGLTSRVLAAKFGAEATTLTVAQLPSHTHTLPGGGTTGATGGGQSVSDTQPSLAVEYIIAEFGVDPSSSSFNNSSVPLIGEVRPFALGGSRLPDGFAFAEGQVLNIADFPDLFNVIGKTYGGDGVTTFALPDLRGRVPVEAGTGLGLARRDLGVPFGTESVTLTVDQLPAHSHTTGQAPPHLLPKAKSQFILPFNQPFHLNIASFAVSPSGQPLTFTDVSSPVDRKTGAVKGSLTTNGGTLTYTPPKGFRGRVSFSFRVTDANGSTQLFTVTLLVGLGIGVGP